MRKHSLKPIVKWAGGKSQLIEKISARFPSEFGESIKKYAEPFVGSGALLFYILENYNLEKVYISDTNAELINMYKVVKGDANALISLLKSFELKYLSMEYADRKEYFYKKRNEFNSIILSKSSAININAAALFIFLNRTCFNGLYRVNKKGLFNVPMGSYKNPKICDEENIKAVSEALQTVSIVCGDYHLSKSFIDSNTLVYFDPPYRPLNSTSSFTSYTEDAFDDKDQEDLAEYVKELSKKGALILLSNSDPKNIDPKDNFFDNLYKGFDIERVSATRMINSNASARGEIKELLIRNY